MARDMPFAGDARVTGRLLAGYDAIEEITDVVGGIGTKHDCGPGETKQVFAAGHNLTAVASLDPTVGPYKAYRAKPPTNGPNRSLPDPTGVRREAALVQGRA